MPVFDPHPRGIAFGFHGAGISQVVLRKGAKAHNGKNYKARVVGGRMAEDLFKRGLCLPSGTAMTNEDIERVVSVILSCREKK